MSETVTVSMSLMVVLSAGTTFASSVSPAVGGAPNRAARYASGERKGVPWLPQAHGSGPSTTPPPDMPSPGPHGWTRCHDVRSRAPKMGISPRQQSPRGTLRFWRAQRSPLAEIHELSAVALRDALRSGELSARQAAAHFLDRIANENPHLGAFITVTAEQALKDAAAADSRHLDAANDGAAALPLLHGMPTAFKDLTDVAGVVTTHGSAALEHKPAPADGALAAALKSAGVVSLGKTQVPEFGLTAYSENRIAPPSRNPHALSRSSGGSSGGSAAAVAARLLPFAPGSDGGGSIRIPAAACGLVGLKPGRGLVPAGESTGDPARLVVAGPLARSAADAALLLDALVPPENAPENAPQAARHAPGQSAGRRASYLELAGQDAPRLRIGVSLDSPWQAVFPVTPEREALDALAAGIRLLEAAGHATGEAAIRYDNRYPGAFTTAWTAGVGSARIAPQREALLTPLTRTFRRRAQSAAQRNWTRPSGSCGSSSGTRLRSSPPGTWS